MSGRSLQPVEKSTGTPFDIVTYLEQATFLQQQPSCHPSHLTAYSQPYNDDEGFRRFLSQKVSCAEEFLRVALLFAGITAEQRERLRQQRETYREQRAKHSDQLLRLKEEREDMKEKGYKHEDELMKENAKLQVQNGLRSMRGRFFKYIRPRIEEKTFVYVAEVRCTSIFTQKKYNTDGVASAQINVPSSCESCWKRSKFKQNRVHFTAQVDVNFFDMSQVKPDLTRTDSSIPNISWLTWW